MRTPYKLEIFDRSRNCKDFTPIAEPTIDFDYIDLSRMNIALPRNVNAAKGDFVSVSDMDGNIAFQGIVDAMTLEKKKNSLAVRPLLALLDVKSRYDINNYSGNLEALWRLLIRDCYVDTTDSSQKISNILFNRPTTTSGTLTTEEDPFDLWEIAVQTLKRYGVSIECQLRFSDMALRFTISKPGASGMVIDADSDNVLDIRIDLATYDGVTNKLTIVNEENTSQSVTYYLHPNGTVNTTDSDRITPVIWDYDLVTVPSGETFADVAAAAAAEALVPPDSDDLIRVTLARDDRMTPPDDIRIGQTATIIKDGVSYTGMLTGYKRGPSTTELIFGALRLDLTKILRQKERKR